MFVGLSEGTDTNPEPDTTTTLTRIAIEVSHCRAVFLKNYENGLQLMLVRGRTRHSRTTAVIRRERSTFAVVSNTRTHQARTYSYSVLVKTHDLKRLLCYFRNYIT
ncbi:unnamed protein product [Amoebophrya sp. A120]|nr:unnamed protein product [Amoebophrya sp. A120]|eukprot:GSA120T00024763001.1